MPKTCGGARGTEEEGLAAQRRGSRRGTRVHELFRDGLDAEVEPFQATRPQQHEVARLSEYDLVRRSLPGYVDRRTARPSLKDGPVSLTEQPLVVALDAK